MNKKLLTTYILLGALAILIGIVLLIKFVPTEKNVAPEEKSFYQNLDTQLISKIEIINKQVTQTLIKEADSSGNETWYVQKDADKKEADATQINSLLSKIYGIKVTDPVTTNKEKQALFQVDDTALHVKMYQKEQLVVDLYIGKNTPDYVGVYLRKNGEDAIYQCNERLNYDFNVADFEKKASTNTNQ